MDSFEYSDKRQIEVMVSNELIALECLSDNEDRLGFRWFNAGPICKLKGPGIVGFT